MPDTYHWIATETFAVQLIDAGESVVGKPLVTVVATTTLRLAMARALAR